MKKILISLAVFTLNSFLFAQTGPNPSPPDLKIGDDLEQMKELLGEPRGLMESGEIGIYYYKLGSVHTKAGKVTAMNLISEQEWVERNQAVAEAREQRKIKGEELLQAIKDDPEFATMPAKERFSFWQQFRRDYPEVDIYMLYSQAKIEVDKVLEEERNEKRIADLERRVMLAEHQARKAAEAAETQRIFAQNRYYSNRYPPVIVYPQYIIRNGENHHQNHPTPRISHPQSGLNIRLNLGSGSSRSSTSTSGFVNGQNGVFRVESNKSSW